MTTKLRTQRTMHTDTPGNTAIAIQKLEKAVSDAVDALDSSKATRMKIQTVSNGATYQAEPWDCVVASAASYVNLPSPTPSLAGSEVAVVSADASTIRVIPLNSKVRGATSLNYAFQQQVTFICDGVNWW